MKLSADQVALFLTQHMQPGVDGVASLAGGDWSQAFAFRSAGIDYVIRFGADCQGYVNDQLAAQFTSDTLPIPQVIELGEAFGGYFMITERAFGSMIDDLDAAAMRQVIPAFFNMLDGIRSVDIGSTHRFGRWNAAANDTFSSWREYLLTINADRPGLTAHGWKSALKHSAVGDGLFNHAYAVLKDAVVDIPEVRSLIHNDLLHYNVLVKDNRITAVIDWGNALCGDFLYDIAQYLFWAPYYPSMHGIDWQSELLCHYRSIGLAVPQFSARLRCCQIHIGLDAQIYCVHMQRWHLLEGIAKRTVAVAK